jgi:hypothetical protein
MGNATRRINARLRKRLLAEAEQDLHRMGARLKELLTPAERAVLEPALREQGRCGVVEWTPALRPIALKVYRDAQAMAVWERFRYIRLALGERDPGRYLRRRL